MPCRLYRYLATLACLAVWPWLPASAAERCENPPQLRFSMVPAGNIEQRIKAYQPLFSRLEAMTTRPVVVVRPSSYAAVIEGLLSANLDVAALGPASYVEAKRADADVVPFATYVKRAGTYQVEGPYYHALLVTLADSRFDQVEKLAGARLALTDPASTSGSLLPREEFTPRLGMPMEKYFGAVSFSGSHTKSIDALLRGDIDAAFVASTQLDEALEMHKFSPAQIRILWKSAPIPYDPFVMRGELCEPLKKRIRSAFLDNPEALRAMFDEIDARRFAPVDDSHYSSIRKVLDKLHK